MSGHSRSRSHSFCAFLWPILASVSVAFAQPAPAPAVNSAPSITGLDPTLPTLWIVGDSTVARGRGATQQGWGVPLADYFDPAKINIANRARGGRSTRTFVNEGLWEQLLAGVKKGDTVLLQFGHNDGGPINTRPARGSLSGLGDETQDIESITTNRPESVHTFGWYLRKMIADVKAKGANPIVLSFGAYLRHYVADIRAKQAMPMLCSLVPRKIWKDGKIALTANSHADWTREVAAAEHVAFLDLHEFIASRYDALGEAAVNPLFADERVHTTKAGAELNAECVVAALRALPQNPLAPFLLTPVPARLNQGLALPSARLLDYGADQACRSADRRRAYSHAPDRASHPPDRQVAVGVRRTQRSPQDLGLEPLVNQDANRAPTSLADDFDEDAFSSAAVELAIENLFPRSEIQFAFRNRDDDFASHDLAFQMGVGVIFASPVVLIVGSWGMRR